MAVERATVCPWGVDRNLRVAERVDEFLARSGIGEGRFFQARIQCDDPELPYVVVGVFPSRWSDSHLDSARESRPSRE
jgi:hypothetical protein